jgi:hypothetical protein
MNIAAANKSLQRTQKSRAADLGRYSALLTGYSSLFKKISGESLFMKNMILTFVILSLFVSCDFLSTSRSGEIEIKLIPQIASINDPVKLVIKNETNQTFRYHCGHTVEIKQNEEWIEHIVTGCANSFPEEIKPGQRYEIDDFLLSPTEPGYYRVIVAVLSDGEDFSDTGRISETVKFIDTN